MAQDGQSCVFQRCSFLILAAQLHTRVLDRAIQVFGAMGLTLDTPLADLWTWGRAMRFVRVRLRPSQ